MSLDSLICLVVIQWALISSDADTMMSAWTRFASSGNPNGKNIDGWEAFHTKQ